MPEEFANAVLNGFAAYGGAGIVFAVIFLAGGGLGMDQGLRTSGVMARLILLPGIVALWPLLALRLLLRQKFTG
jgi:hypothetical protein